VFEFMVSKLGLHSVHAAKAGGIDADEGARLTGLGIGA